MYILIKTPFFDRPSRKGKGNYSVKFEKQMRKRNITGQYWSQKLYENLPPIVKEQIYLGEKFVKSLKEVDPETDEKSIPSRSEF